MSPGLILELSWPHFVVLKILSVVLVGHLKADDFQCLGLIYIHTYIHTYKYIYIYIYINIYINETELSKHVWMLKDSNKSYKVVWCIVARAPPYKSGSGRCALCLTEKSVIVRANPKGLLNKRTELISKCRHRNKYLLCNIPSPPA